jgi:hypothetical protein
MTDPEGPFSRHVRALFREKDVPVSAFVPLATEEAEGKLSQLDGEPAYFQVPRRETVGDLDLLVLSGSGADALCRGLATSENVPVFDVETHPAAATGIRLILSVLSEPPTDASFNVLLPAAELGNVAVEELFEQAGDSLNFRPTKSSALEGRLAFNTLRDSASRRLEKTVRTSLKAEFPGCRLQVVLARAGFFHGYCGAGFLRFDAEKSAARAAASLSRNPAISVGRKAGFASPAAAVEASALFLELPEVEGPDVSTWFAFDGLALAAGSVLDLARSLLV